MSFIVAVMLIPHDYASTYARAALSGRDVAYESRHSPTLFVPIDIHQAYLHSHENETVR